MYAKFLKEEAGAQIIEYALIVAAVSLSLVLALQATTLGANFQNFITRISACLATGPCS